MHENVTRQKINLHGVEIQMISAFSYFLHVNAGPTNPMPWRWENLNRLRQNRNLKFSFKARFVQVQARSKRLQGLATSKASFFF